MTGRTRSVLTITMSLGAIAGCSRPEPAEEPTPDTPTGMVRLSESQIGAANITTVSAVEVTIQDEVSVPGSVQSPDHAHAVVGAIVEGQVMRVTVLPGDEVRRGQPLVEIHAHEMAEVQRDLASARAEVEFRANALDRSEKLLAAGAVSAEEVERRRADLSAAEAELALAEGLVAHLHPSPSGDARAVSPLQGTVFNVHVRAGQAVVAGDPLVEVGSTDVLWVTAFVPENRASTLAVGDAVNVTFDAPPATSTGRLVRAGTHVDPANRSVEMRFELDSIPAGIRPGSFATVGISLSSPEPGVRLDEEAVVRLGDDDVVFVVETHGLYRPVVVSIASHGDGEVAVRGIPDGSEVVVEGAYFLKAAFDAESAEDGGP